MQIVQFLLHHRFIHDPLGMRAFLPELVGTVRLVLAFVECQLLEGKFIATFQIVVDAFACREGLESGNLSGQVARRGDERQVILHDHVGEECDPPAFDQKA